MDLLEGKVFGGHCWEKLTLSRLRNDKCLENYGYRVYSQNDEDGIICEIFNRIGTENKEFIEFGVQDGLECNSHMLLHRGWRGLWIEGSSKYCKKIGYKFKPVIKKGRLKVCNSFITKDNIDRLINENAYGSKEPDFLSIDIDGNDWYVWKAINAITPRVVCVEYNGKFPPDYSWKQAYDEKHIWDGSDWQGASLKALEELGREKGYQLVCTNLSGVNAFFVRDDLVGDQFPFSGNAEELYNPNRSAGLRFFAPGQKARYGLICQEDKLGIKNYYSSRREFKKAMRQEHLKLKQFFNNLYVFIRE